MAILDLFTIVKTRQRNMPLYKVKKGLPIGSMEGWVYVSERKKHRNVEMRSYTFETYAKTLRIQCSEDTLILEEKGWKPIGTVKKGDSLYMVGVFVPFKLSMVKSVSVTQKHTCEQGSSLEIAEGTAFYANEMVVKS